MLKTLARLIAAGLVLLPFAAGAEPIRLKLSFFTSDRSTAYRAMAKPFVDAVNAEAKGLIEIQVYFSSVLGKLPEQPELLRNGAADIAVVVPGLNQGQFPDNGVIELPGLYRDLRESTAVFTKLTAAGVLRGYEDFVVLGAFATEAESIHTRVPVTRLDELKGVRIRANNPIVASALQKLGAVPVIMAVTQAAGSISSGEVDGAAVPPSPVMDFGIGRVATYHYVLRTSAAPIMLLMNRKRFESLPTAAQDIMRKYGGEWMAEHFVRVYEAEGNLILEQLHKDPKRKVTFPSKTELERAQVAFRAVVDEWAAKNPRHRHLLRAAEAEIQDLRASD